MTTPKGTKPFPRFRTWLMQQTNRENIIGLFAEDIRENEESGEFTFPDGSTWKTYEQWMKLHSLFEHVMMRALRAAWNTYQDEKSEYEEKH